MKINKTILTGILFLLISGVILTTDFLNPIVRPVTYLFLMGSSKGKDIIFFGLFGLFLILSQLFKREINNEKYLKISIGVGSVLLVSGILLEIIFRIRMGISLNSVFCSMTDNMTSTSILHTHLLKSYFGEFLTNNFIIQGDINTGVALYSYLPDFAGLIVLLFPILFVFLVLANQNRVWVENVFLSFFSSCLIIGAVDGGLFSTPAIFGICGLYLIYRNRYYVNLVFGKLLNDDELLKSNKNNTPAYINFKGYKYLFNRGLVYIVIVLIILLRLSIAFAGAQSDYYTVDVVNPSSNIELNDIPVESVYHGNNSITFIINSDYNEMELINDLKVPLNNSCEYYTVSWNIYSYF